jgi:hypothetical protein
MRQTRRPERNRVDSGQRLTTSGTIWQTTEDAPARAVGERLFLRLKSGMHPSLLVGTSFQEALRGDD